jgi:hypothetical protein
MNHQLVKSYEMNRTFNDTLSIWCVHLSGRFSIIVNEIFRIEEEV